MNEIHANTHEARGDHEAREGHEAPASEGDGTKPIATMRYGQFRDAALTLMASALSRTKRPLWYAESLVLSARYLQWLRSSPWAADALQCRDRLELWNRAVLTNLRGKEATVLEFGVAEGIATHWWAATGVRFAAWHGFDTFEGLPASWDRAGVPVMEAGVFLPGAGRGAVPQVQAPYPHTWHKGLIEDTLPPIERPDGPLFVLIDVDLLDPTLSILHWLLENGRPGDLVYFDESFDPWNEGMAIRRALDDGLRFRALGYTAQGLVVELQEPRPENAVR